MRKILAITFIALGLTIPQKAQAITIVDSLGEATPSKQFSVFGTAGLSISPNQFFGPNFVLTEPTIITEIGGFVNNCKQIISGQPNCPNTLPFTVEIYPSLNGVPDRFNKIQSFTLSHDNNPLVISYESVSPNLLLEPGAYFALFAPQGSDSGFLLEFVQNLNFSGESVAIGGLTGDNQRAFFEESRTSRVRVLGTPLSIPEPTNTLGLIGTGLIALLCCNRYQRKS